jgi:hypothetical protein
MKIGFIIIIIFGVVAFIPIQMILPFPYGLGLGIGIIAIGIGGAIGYLKISKKGSSKEIPQTNKFCTKCGTKLFGNAKF